MNKRKSVIIMLIVFLAIGFATVSTTLVINGILAIGENKDDFNIIFTSAKLDGRKRNDFISEDKKHINFVSNELKNLDDTTTLTYEVTNTSRNYDADVQVTCTAGSTELIAFEYTPHQMEVLAGETKTGSFAASMFKVVDEPTEVPIECTLTGSAKTRVDLGEEYIPPFSKSGVLMATPSDNATEKKYWAYKYNITRTIFEDKLASHETTENLIFDVSEAQDGSVMAYLIKNDDTLTTNKDYYGTIITEDENAYTLYLQSDTGVKANPNSSRMFSNFFNLKSIENIKLLDTSLSTTMERMFADCNAIKTIDVSNFDTSNVTSMVYMFGSGSGFNEIKKELTEIIGLEAFDTSKVKYMNCMFASFSNATELNVKGFDTSNVTNMDLMFSRCTNLANVDVSNFNTSNVQSFYCMFYGCGKLTSIDVSNWNTSNVTNMQSVFNSSGVTYLNVKNWDTSKVTNMSQIFAYCFNLTSIDVSSWDTSNVKAMDSMFSNCSSLTSLDVSNFNTSSATTMRLMFSDCKNITELNVSHFDTTNVKNFESLFAGCEKITNLEISNWNTSNATNMNSLFSGCKNLESLDVSNWDTTNVTDFGSLFAYCGKISTFDVSNWNTSNVENMGSVFAYCRSLTNLDVSSWDTSKATTMRAMFVECSELRNLDLSHFDTTNVVNMQAFLGGCHRLTTTFTIRGTNCTEFTATPGWSTIFASTAIYDGAVVTVNYTADASDLVDQMIATKSETSNVVKGAVVS